MRRNMNQTGFFKDVLSVEQIPVSSIFLKYKCQKVFVEVQLIRNSISVVVKYNNFSQKKMFSDGVYNFDNFFFFFFLDSIDQILIMLGHINPNMSSYVQVLVFQIKHYTSPKFQKKTCVVTLHVEQRVLALKTVGGSMVTTSIKDHIQSRNNNNKI